MPSVSRRYAREVPHFDRPSGRDDAATKGPVVLMVSGGADSTALLILATTTELDIDDGRGTARLARERLHVLHVNHGLRGEASDGDEAFVRQLCSDFGVPCTVEHIDVAARAQANGATDSNVENVGREARYEAATKLANTLCAQMGVSRSVARIVTAHTANDRTETFFMNAIKGSGAQGLSSIPRRRNHIVRPLLGYTHEQLCTIVHMRGIVWREDATNADTHYLRSFVRHEIIPRALERNPRLMETMGATCDILSDEDAYLTQIAATALRKLERRRAPGVIVLDAERLAASEVVLARRVVRMAVVSVCPDCRLDAHHITQVLHLVAAQTGSTTLPFDIDVRVSYGLLFIRTRASMHHGLVAGWLDIAGLKVVPQASTYLARPGQTTSLDVGLGITITARLREVAPDSDAVAFVQAYAREWDGTHIMLDAGACGVSAHGGRLWVDSPQAGDVLCPLGMHGQSKKLSDVLIDEKIPAADRGCIPVVRTSPTGSIVWVAPLRLDERARVSAASRVLLELQVHRSNPGIGENFVHRTY